MAVNDGATVQLAAGSRYRFTILSQEGTRRHVHGTALKSGGSYVHFSMVSAAAPSSTRYQYLHTRIIMLTTNQSRFYPVKDHWVGVMSPASVTVRLDEMLSEEDVFVETIAPLDDEGEKDKNGGSGGGESGQPHRTPISG